VTATATAEMRAAAHTTGVTASKVTAPAKVTAAMSTTTMATASMATASAASGVGCTRKCDRKNNHGQNFEF
jgi:hypothetical protein